MSYTPNLSLPMLVQNQSGKEVTHNEALVIIDTLLNNGIIDTNQNTPPATPNVGDTYIISSTPTDEFISHEGELAFYNNGWRFLTPKEGLTLWSKSEDKLYTYDGSNWIDTNSTCNELNELTDVVISAPSQNDLIIHNGTNFVNTKSVDNLERLGINTTADSSNKLAIASDYVLFNNNGTDARIKVNKNSSLNTASYLFQSNWSGRAEFGLVGDDNFTLKVSADGSTWNDSLIIDNSTGDTAVKQNLDINGNLSAGATNEAGVVEVKDDSGIVKAKLNANGDNYINGGSLAIGNSAIDTKAILDIQSTTKGVLFPRITTTQRDAISEPTEGLIVYNTTLHKLQCYDGTTWQSCF